MVTQDMVSVTEVRGFESVGYEQSMWVKKDGSKTIMLCTNVDDSFVTASDENTRSSFKEHSVEER